MRPPGFEPGTCGLRVRGRGVQGVLSSPLTRGSIFGLSIELGASSPNDAEIVGSIVGVDRAVSELKRSLGMVVNLEFLNGDTLFVSSAP